MGQIFSYISRKFAYDTCKICERTIVDSFTAKCRVCNETNHFNCYKAKIAHKHFGLCLTCSENNGILVLPYSSMRGLH